MLMMQVLILFCKSRTAAKIASAVQGNPGSCAGPYEFCSNSQGTVYLEPWVWHDELGPAEVTQSLKLTLPCHGPPVDTVHSVQGPHTHTAIQGRTQHQGRVVGVK